MKKVVILIVASVVFSLLLFPAVVFADGSCEGAPWSDGAGQYAGASWSDGAGQYAGALWSDGAGQYAGAPWDSGVCK